jgi:2OG-Fe(II) oxygenase superfamily
MSITDIDTTPQAPFLYRSLNPAAVNELSARFLGAKPFPHIQIQHFLNLTPEQALPWFPAVDWPGWGCFGDPYQHRKMYCNDIERIPPALVSLIHDLCSPAFLRFLEKVTGLEALIPDPYLEGGGLHCSGPGGILAPHTDFHQYRRLHLYRRVNVLVYLNREWKESYGGCLELYEKGSKTPAVTVTPEWGTCVIFRTDDKSVHGFSKPIVDGRWRRSIALYYYTSKEAPVFGGDYDTHWQEHGELSSWGQARLQLYKAFMFGSRCCSRLAHRANPRKAISRGRRI